VALLLTDLVLPGGLGGQELGRRLAVEQPGLKVIFASGYSADIAGRDFQLRPGEAFVQKPFAMDHLLETIRRCLDG
jgi:FixJ family two-component response regulator